MGKRKVETTMSIAKGPGPPLQKYIQGIEHLLNQLKHMVRTAATDFATYSAMMMRILVDCRLFGRGTSSLYCTAERLFVFQLGVEAIQAVALAAQAEYVQADPDLATLGWISPEACRGMGDGDPFRTRFAIAALDMDELHATDPSSDDYLAIVAEVLEYCSGVPATAQFGDMTVCLPAVPAYGRECSRILFKWVAIALVALSRSHSEFFGEGVMEPVHLWDQLVPGTGVGSVKPAMPFPRQPCVLYKQPRTGRHYARNTIQQHYWNLIHGELTKLLRIPLSDINERSEAALDIVLKCAEARHVSGYMTWEFHHELFSFGVQALRALMLSVTDHFNLPPRYIPGRESFDRKPSLGPQPRHSRTRDLRRWAILRALKEQYNAHPFTCHRVELAKAVLAIASGIGLITHFAGEDRMVLTAVRGAGLAWKREAMRYARLGIVGAAEFLSGQFLMQEIDLG